MPLIKIL